jgi:hypothetical protein
MEIHHADSARWRLKQFSTSPAAARQRYNIFGKPFVEPKDINTASLRDLCLFIRDTGTTNLC